MRGESVLIRSNTSEIRGIESNVTLEDLVVKLEPSLVILAAFHFIACCVCEDECKLFACYNFSVVLFCYC